MISKIYKELFILILLFIGLWLAFIYVPQPSTPEMQLSIENEEKIGDLMMETYLKTAEVIDNNVADSAMEIILKRLEDSIDFSGYTYKLYVVKNEEANAFATLGGNIVVFTGLIDLSGNPEEIAAVLAHEIGHVEKKHVVNKLVKELGITLVLSILSGADPGVINQILKISISTAFDRSQESEADDFAIELLEKTKISPSHMAAVFKKISNKYESEYTKSLEMISTHPDSKKRIKKALSHKLPSDFQPEKIDVNWQEVKDNLKQY